jgi:hypothetical protein
MTRKPFAAFGRILYANYCEKGYEVDAAASADSKTVLLLTEGSLTVRDKNTGQVLHECAPGWVSYGNYEDTIFSCVANEASVLWCYDPKVNQGYAPQINLFEMKQGQSMIIDSNTNLFLCKGTLLVNEKQYAGPYQIAVRTNGNNVVALTDIRGLLFR